MINVAVVNGKETIKYLVRIVGAVIIVAILARFFCILKERNINNAKLVKESKNIEKKESEISMKSLMFCIDEAIPLIKESKLKENQIETYKIALTKELRSTRFNRKEKYNKK